ncbi:hypothetical protein H8356DRAFT_1734984 [Neocallimastix lanati (nom. inval.)]|jgi:hypothetical protein|nr:hypothetical protein H8356DRAFT_1734984 [Neocallimastix sp. JGI-2020a]
MVSYNKQNTDNSLKENNISVKNSCYNKIITPRIIKSSYDIYDINQKSRIHKKDKNIVKSRIIKSSISIYDGLTPLDYTFSNRNKTKLKVNNKIKPKYKNISSLSEISIKKNHHESKENIFTPTENNCKLPDIYYSNSVPNNHIYKPQIAIQPKESILDDNIDRYITDDNQNFYINVDKNDNSKKVNKLESQLYYKRRSPNYSKYDSKEMFPDTNAIMKKIESEYSINDYSDEEDNIALDFYYQNPEYNNEIKENSKKDYFYDTDNFIKNYKISNSFQKEYSKNDYTDEYVLFNEEKDIPINKLKSFISTKSLKNVNSLDNKLNLSLKKKYKNENVTENNLMQEVKTCNSNADNKYTNNNSIKNTEENGDNNIIKKNKCEYCNKKLRITATYKCKCGKIFCAAHRYSECHNCTYDYKKQGKKDLEKNNPLVVKDKLQKC